MKHARLFLSLAMMFALFSSRPAVIAIPNPVVSDVSPDFLIGSSMTHTMDIYFVGTSGLDQDEISMDTDGTYHVTTDSSAAYLTFKINLTGYTQWDIENWVGDFTYGVDSNTSTTVGHIFRIIDGEVTTVTGGANLGDSGTTAFLGLGSHTVTFLYMSMKQDGTILYAHDSVTIRVGESADFSAISTMDAAVTVDHTDAAETATELNQSLVVFEPGWFEFYRSYDYVPPVDASIEMGGSAYDATKTYPKADVGNLSLTSTVDSTSALGMAWGDSDWDYWGSESITEGISFFADADGLHMIDSTTTSVDATIRVGEAGTLEETFVGVMTFMGAGFWHESAFYYAVADWEGIASTTNGTTASTVDEPVSFDSSYDFYPNVDGQTFRVTEELVTVTETIDEEGTTSTVTDTPGFTALLGLLSLGTLAFVAPRLRKK